MGENKGVGEEWGSCRSGRLEEELKLLSFSEEFFVLSQKLVDLLDLSHRRHKDISVERPPRFGRLGDLAKLCVGKRQ